MARKEAAAEQSGKKRTFSEAVTARIKSVVNNEKHPPNQTREFRKNRQWLGKQNQLRNAALGEQKRMQMPRDKIQMKISLFKFQELRKKRKKSDLPESSLTKEFFRERPKKPQKKEKIGLIGQNVKHGKNIKQYLKKIRNKLSKCRNKQKVEEIKSKRLVILTEKNLTEAEKVCSAEE